MQPLCVENTNKKGRRKIIINAEAVDLEFRESFVIQMLHCRFPFFSFSISSFRQLCILSLKQQYTCSFTVKLSTGNVQKKFEH